jgi:hypothetical protein
VLGRRRSGRQSSSAQLPPYVGGFNGLRTWLLSLPFVDERSDGGRNTNLHEFVIDCPPLGIWRTWLMIRAADSDAELLAFMTHVDREVSSIRFAPPSTSADARHVENVLILAYESAFA